MEKINDNSSVPKYKQLAKIIINEFNKIDENYNSILLDSDDKLLTERDLSKHFNVSRITVRQAMDILKKENYINRIQGKGTYFNRNKIVKPLKTSKSFSKVVLESGHSPGAKLISASIKLANKLDQATFNISKDDYVFVMKRLRFVDGIAVAYEVSHFNKKFADLQSVNFDDKSIYEFLEKERGINLNFLEKTIEIVYANDEIAKIFNIELNTPVILLKAIVANQYGEITHNVFEYLLSDKFIFKI